ncbi:hypothetical protein DYB32_001219 [Aphanomyces invadans]|uniref:Uncharacterized protein n=1 Tax=Aphanomyces invadans TaxID=157072 RepID=A0A418B741_9STRA|nr:hypothetical protein DYB32_001219 [Aphanomyces invadans]
MHHLRRLELTSLADVTAVDLLFGALPGSTITELVLEGVNEMHYRHDREQILSDVAVHGMSSWLERSAKPTTLCLDKLVFQCALPVAERFMRALQESMLTSIQLHHCRHQMALAFPPTLVHLALSDTRSSAESEQRVIDALGDPASQLRTLDLSWYSMSSRTLSLLATSIPSSTLILLDVSYTCLLDRGAVALASSLPHTCLQDVHLGYNEITNVGGEMLATALKDAPTLRKLHLQGNFLGESGMAALVQVATTRPEPVEWVDLTNNDKFFFTALVRVHAMYRRLSQQYSSTCVVLLDKCDLPQHR